MTTINSNGRLQGGNVRKGEKGLLIHELSLEEQNYDKYIGHKIAAIEKALHLVGVTDTVADMHVYGDIFCDANASLKNISVDGDIVILNGNPGEFDSSGITRLGGSIFAS